MEILRKKFTQKYQSKIQVISLNKSPPSPTAHNAKQNHLINHHKLIKSFSDKANQN
jgi:hypothetical protein